MAQSTSNVVVNPVEGDRQRHVIAATDHGTAVNPGNEAREPAEWSSVGGLFTGKRTRDWAAAAAAQALGARPGGMATEPHSGFCLLGHHPNGSCRGSRVTNSIGRAATSSAKWVWKHRRGILPEVGVVGGFACIVASGGTAAAVCMYGGYAFAGAGIAQSFQDNEIAPGGRPACWQHFSIDAISNLWFAAAGAVSTAGGSEGFRRLAQANGGTIGNATTFASGQIPCQ